MLSHCAAVSFPFDPFFAPAASNFPGKVSDRQCNPSWDSTVMGNMVAAVAERGAAQGDAGAPVDIAGFETWMAAEQKRVYLLCLRLLGTSDEADSATQDVFLKAYRALERGRPALLEPAKWLTRGAVRKLRAELRDLYER